MINIVAQNLQRSLRETDVVSRTDGDELVIILVNTYEHDAQKFMERSDKVFSELYMTLNNIQKHMVTVSAGVA